MLELPLVKWLNQNFMVRLDDQDCAINLYQRGKSVYLDLFVDGETVCRGSLCQSGVGIIQNANSFSGQLVLTDEWATGTGQEAPDWKGFGERWKLYWLSAEEVAAMKEARFTETRNG